MPANNPCREVKGRVKLIEHGLRTEEVEIDIFTHIQPHIHTELKDVRQFNGGLVVTVFPLFSRNFLVINLITIWVIPNKNVNVVSKKQGKITQGNRE